MADERRARVERIFEDALDLDASERAAALDAACAGDDALRAEVEALLRAHDRAGMLDRPIARPRMPERIGSYRVLDVLGRGGMGIVYLAERDDGHFRQRVAIKLIRNDDDPELPARMVAERQILATLDHPNIARLLDGGVLADGRPYLVMEHVPGLPIDVYCDRMRLSIAERVRLFTIVARAVEHAHRNLIVHRDLKPSNILVTPEARPKLLDFGIAKLLNPVLAGIAAPMTRTERRALTPEYASPEQLRGESLTTTSDVYSLGVVLYRLLTGRLPYDAKPTTAAMMEQVLHGDAPAPSDVLSRRAAPDQPEAASLVSVARDRATTPERLQRQLRGDLDAIVSKALRREPISRYGSAEQLAQDLEAWLRGEPVLAHRGSQWYRAQKLVRRHKASALAASVVAVSLVLGAGTATWQARVARHERDRAESARVEAQTVTDFLMELFRSGEGEAGGGEVTAAALLRRGVARADLLSEQPLVQARMLDVVGQMHYGLARYEEAESLLNRAAGIQRAQGPAGRIDLASTLVHLSWTLRARARDDEARALVTEALAIRRTDLPPNHPDLAESLFELGWLSPRPEQERLYREAVDILALSGENVDRRVFMMLMLTTNLRRQARFDEALAMNRDALTVARTSLGENHPTTALAMIHYADQVRDLVGDADQAERLYRDGLAIQERLHGPRSARLIHGINSLAEVMSAESRHAEAEALLRRGLEIQQAATGPQHPTVAGELGRLAGVLHDAGRTREAERYATQSLELYESLLGDQHPAYAAALGTLASVNEALGRRDSALVLLGKAVAIRELRPDWGPLGESYRNYGLALMRHGRAAEAERALLRSLEVLEANVGADHPSTDESRRALSRYYAERGRPDLAARYDVPPGRPFIPY